jgi:hypothetical protein
MAYTIQISEEQRVALLQVLEEGHPLCAVDAPLDFWPDMLRKLPEAEAESPGCFHGFCL